MYSRISRDMQIPKIWLQDECRERKWQFLKRVARTYERARDTRWEERSRKKSQKQLRLKDVTCADVAVICLLMREQKKSHYSIRHLFLFHTYKILLLFFSRACSQKGKKRSLMFMRINLTKIGRKKVLLASCPQQCIRFFFLLEIRASE